MPPFTVLDQADGQAVAGLGEVAQVAGRNQPWLYLFDVYDGSIPGTAKGDYDILWLDRGSIPGKLLPWTIRKRGGMVKTMGNPLFLTLPIDAFNSVRVPVRNEKISPADVDSYSVGFASSSGLLVLQVGSRAKESKSPFVTSGAWIPKDQVANLKTIDVLGKPAVVIPFDPRAIAGGVTFQPVTISDKMEREGTSITVPSLTA